MSGTIVVQPAAEQDLDEHADYLAESSFETAVRFSRAVAETFQQIASLPMMGSPRRFRNPALVGLRMWRVRGFESYLIFYRPTDDGIEVLRVLHGARDIEALLESLEP